MIKPIWIVRRHPMNPYGFTSAPLDAFTIKSTHATKKEAMSEANALNAAGRSFAFFSVGRVALKKGKADA